MEASEEKKKAKHGNKGYHSVRTNFHTHEAHRPIGLSVEQMRKRLRYFTHFSVLKSNDIGCKLSHATDIQLA